MPGELFAGLEMSILVECADAVEFRLEVDRVGYAVRFVDMCKERFHFLFFLSKRFFSVHAGQRRCPLGALQ